MKKFILSCVVISLTIPTAQAIAKTGIFNIQANYNDIKITLDGNPVNTSNEPFIYNGVTYLPVRDVSEAIGLDVEWDSTSKIVKLSRPSNTLTNNTPISSNEIILSGGNYVVGEDFPEGTYNITCLDGFGHISSSDYKFSAILASENEKNSSEIYSSYDSIFKNATFAKGITLKIPSGIKIKLEKVK